MTGPQPTREQYLQDLSDAQLYADHQRLQPLGAPHRDAALSEAITRITQVAPWTRQVPRFVVDMANDALSTGSLDQALVDVQDSTTFMATTRQREELRRSSTETQQTVWDSLPRKAQQGLRTQGYLPPSEDPNQRTRDPGFNRAQMGPVDNGILGAIGQVVGGAGKLVGDAVGGGLQLVGGQGLRDAGSWLWNGVQTVGKIPTDVYRAERLQGFSGGAAFNPGIAVNDLVRNVDWNPGTFLDNLRDAWDGEKTFDPKVAKQVAETFNDEDAYQFVKRLATGESVYDIAKDMGAPGTPAYANAVGQLLDFSENGLVRDGIAALQKGHISPGRDLANGLHLDPDSAAYTAVSGAGDAAFQWYADPTLALGKLNAARLASKIGLTVVGGDVVNRVLSFYNEALDARSAARAVTDVTHPGYWNALRAADLNPTERAATALADHVSQGEYARLLQAMPGTSRLQPALETLRRTLSTATPEEAQRFFSAQGVDDALFQKLAETVPDRAKFIENLADYSREVPVVKPMDVVRYFSGEAGLTALVRGDLAHYRYGFSTLPRLTRGGTIRTAAKIATEDAIDFLADAHVQLKQPILASDVAAGNLDAVQKGANLLLSPMARAFQRVTTMLPAKGYLAFGSRDSVEAFDRLLDYGVRGQTRRDLFDSFIKAGTEAEARNVVQSAFKTMFANAGILDDPEMPSAFVDKWLKSSQQRYALDDLDKLDDGTRAGIWPDADRASAVAIPDFRDLMAEVRRQRFQRLQTGWGGESFWTPALKTLEPVAAFPDRFMRVWRPAAIARPAFPIRAGSEEAITQFARLGPANTLKQWLAIPAAAHDPELVKLTQADLGFGDGLLSWLPSGLRQRASSEAEKVASAVQTRLSRYAQKVVSPEEVRAYRDHIFVDTVGQAFGEVAGKRIGIQGAVLGEDPSVFASISNHTSEGPATVDFTKIGGKFDEYATADDLGRHILADTATHVGRDRVARARLQVRSLFLDEDQAQRIAGTLGLDGEPFDAIAKVRGDVAALPQPVRAKIKAWVDGGGWGEGENTLTNEELGKAVAADVSGGNLSKVMSDMKLLNGSDRRALLADPTRVTEGLDMQDHWPALIDRIQHGDTEAWHQLEDEVGAAHLTSDDLYHHVQGMDRMNPQRFGQDLAKDELVQQWSVLQRKALDQITLDPEGHVIHGITGRLADETLDGPRHILQADYPLPARSYGPALKVVEGRSLAERAVNGFFDWSGTVIKNISRQPLFQHAYAQAYQEAQVLRRFLTDPELDAKAATIFGAKADKASDLLMEVEHRMEEAFRSGASQMRTIGDLDNETLLQTLQAHGLNVDPTDLGTVRDWWGVEREARAHIAQVAATRAVTDSVPYMYDHRARSQAAEMARNVAPFWFAQEQFYKRWARTFQQSPEALARLSLSHHALNAIGWIEKDDQGNDVFVYPGSAYANKAIASFFEHLPGDAKYSLPIGVPLTGQLNYTVPGFDDIAQLPAAGPLIAAPMQALRMISPEMGDPLQKAVLPERARGRDLWSTLLPASVMRLWNVATADEKDLAGTTIAAMQLMEASGHGFPEGRYDPDGSFVPATDGEIQTYLDRLRNFARVTKLTQALVGLAGPASPSPDFDENNLNPEYQKLLQSGMPIEEAVTRFLRQHPDATALTVFGSRSDGKAPTNPTAAALDSLLANKEFFEKYRSVGAWLLPQTMPGSESPFDRQAWQEMMANEIRTRKTDTEMWRDIKYAEAATEFFNNKTKVDAQLSGTTDPEAKRRINAFWKDWSDTYLTLHPVFKTEYESNANHQKRLKVLTDLTQALDDPLAPKVDHAPQLQELIGNYQKLQTKLTESNAGRDHATDRQISARKNMREFFDQWAQGYVAGHPTVEAFYQRIIVPELGLPAETQ